MSYGMDGWNKPSGDLISRAEAIDDLHGKDPSQIWDTADIEVWVNALPSAQPKSYRKGYQAGFKDAQSERKKGKWVFPYETTKMVSICSECGAHGRGNFCPNCGADMRGEADED